MSKLTIVIPARNEIFLQQCVDDIYEHATGDFEVIVSFDDYWPVPILRDRPNLTMIHWGQRRGMRAAINAGAEIGTGDYLMKVDGHCSFPEGFDEVLTSECDVDWLVTPTRYSLDAEKWERKNKPPINYEYLSYPYDEDGKEVGLHGRYWWNERERARKDYDLDENMSFQGSCWLMPMNYFRDLIYPMDEANYGLFVGEPQEIGLKVWLSGGRCMVNKKTWYAHMWKGKWYRDLHRQKLGFGYTRVGRKEFRWGNDFSTDFWFNNRWEARQHDLAWLVDRFAPVPTWPEDRALWTN